MLKSYLKIMLRNLLKRKVYALINILGLATGMAVCLLMVLFIQNEFGYDNFHEKGDQVYRVAIERKYPGRVAYLGSIPQSIGQAIKHEFPEVLESCRMMNFGGNNTTININEKSFEEKKVLAVDSNFFRVFTGSFLQGDGNTSLEKPGTAVINESTAKRFFGSVENAMGKSFILNGFQHYTIDAVCRDWPQKSHFQFNVLISMTSFQGLNVPNYYDFATYTYLLLHKNASPKLLESKFPVIIEKYVSGTIEKGFGETFQQFTADGNGYRYFLQPLKKIHLVSNLEDELTPGGTIGAVYLFGVIAIFILFLACINFINLSTALSVERAKEVGIRKTFGSDKKALISQFLWESISFSLSSVLVAFGIVFLLIPVFNKISGTQLTFAYLLDPVRMLFVIAFAILVGIVAGLYPAFVLSSFKPIVVLKGRFKSNRYGMALRNGLVIFQFAISVTLIICTIVVNRQMQYMLGDKLGFKKDHIIMVENAYLLGKHDHSFLDELSKITGVESISESSTLPGGNNYSSCAMQVVGTKVSRTQKTMYADDNYLKVLGLQLKEGRFFSKEFGADSLGFILNEKAVEDFGLKNPIGSRITSTEVFFNPQDGKTQTVYTVIGVIKDFHFQSLHKRITPLVIANSNKFGGGVLAVRIKGDHFKTSVASIEKIWKGFVTKKTFQYNFLDQRLAEQYKAEQNTEKIFTIFSLLAIFIACIGLFGLATYATLQRTKEIGIRKVLGASTANIVSILSKDFLKLVIISSLIAFPIAALAMYKWLQGYAYRVDISWWVFLLAGIIAATIALLTISFQAIKAAIANPVTSLRTE